MIILVAFPSHANANAEVPPAGMKPGESHFGKPLTATCYSHSMTAKKKPCEPGGVNGKHTRKPVQHMKMEGKKRLSSCDSLSAAMISHRYKNCVMRVVDGPKGEKPPESLKDCKFNVDDTGGDSSKIDIAVDMEGYDGDDCSLAVAKKCHDFNQKPVHFAISGSRPECKGVKPGDQAKRKPAATKKPQRKKQKYGKKKKRKTSWQ